MLDMLYQSTIMGDTDNVSSKQNIVDKTVNIVHPSVKACTCFKTKNTLL